MMSIMLAIKPEYAEAILDGSKKYEFRRRRPGQFRNPTVYLYATAPVSAVIGCAEVCVWDAILLPDLWELTKDQAGISEEGFNRYFHGLEEGFAMSIGQTFRSKPFPLSVYGIRHAPQSWCYMRWEKVL